MSEPICQPVLKEYPSPEILGKMTHSAEALVRRQCLQMGYPFNQDTDLAGFYKWLIETGLCSTTLINVGDPYKTEWDMLHVDEYERAVIDFLADSYGFSGHHWGFISNGGTDGNMHGLYFGRKALQRQSDIPPILYVSEEAHYSMIKLGDVLNLETSVITAHPTGQIDADDLRRKLDPKRPALLGIAIGGTFKGAIDDQRAINAVLEEVSPPAVYRHLDVALFGGYLPWLADSEARAVLDAEKMKFDSLAVSGHKFFGMNEPSGVFICRPIHREKLHSMNVPYLNGEIPTISCSRSGFDALKLYWRVMTLGSDGLQAQAEHCQKMTQYLKKQLDRRGLWNLVNPWSTTVCIKRPKDVVIHKYCMACGECRHFGKLSHVVVMQYFTEQLVDQLVEDLSQE